jgi:hypothetical protein
LLLLQVPTSIQVWVFCFVQDDNYDLSEFEEHHHPEAMDKLKWTIELAKDDAKGSIDHYADKYAKNAKRDVENRFDKLYQEIKQKYKPRN